MRRRTDDVAGSFQVERVRIIRPRYTECQSSQLIASATVPIHYRQATSAFLSPFTFSFSSPRPRVRLSRSLLCSYAPPFSAMQTNLVCGYRTVQSSSLSQISLPAHERRFILADNNDCTYARPLSYTASLSAYQITHIRSFLSQLHCNIAIIWNFAKGFKVNTRERVHTRIRTLRLLR
jgi:hypothetical protein